MTYNSIMKCEGGIHKDLSGNILLSGGKLVLYTFVHGCVRESL